jgi:AraC-like DNA-binding protein
MNEITTHSGLAHVMASTLVKYGCDSHALFEQAGIDITQNMAANDRVASISMQKLWRIAVQETGDESFGLAYAENLHLGALQGLGFSWIASSTLHDAFLRLVRYYRIISSAGEVILEDDSDQYKLWYKIPAPKGVAAPASLDAALAVFIQLCRFAKGDSFSPCRVELQRHKPEDTAKFDAFFNSHIDYDCNENCLYFDRKELESQLPMANPELARVSDQVVIDYLKRYDKGNIVSQIRASIIEWLPSGTPSQEKIASDVHLSPRSLQRKLSELGTSYKVLLDDIRKDLAQHYLRESDRSIGEVTYLLGFSEPSNFARSFTRWTGVTPHEYQQQ